VFRHQETCQHYLTKKCDVCGKMFPLSQFDVHMNWHNQLYDCDNKSHGCTVQYKDVDKKVHLGECVHYSCSNTSCDFIGTLETRKDHISSSCQFRIVTCHLCHASFRAHALDDHVEWCKNRIVECNVCHKELARKDFATHDDDCEKTVTQALDMWKVLLGGNSAILTICEDDYSDTRTDADVLSFIQKSVIKAISSMRVNGSDDSDDD
jgi:hypothetical protein